MAPAQPVTVTVARGVIDTLTMTGPDGAPLAGTIAPDHQTWTLGQHLAFGAAYTVTGPRPAPAPTAGRSRSPERSAPPARTPRYGTQVSGNGRGDSNQTVLGSSTKLGK